jgi:uncharacterized protein YbbC (DUF1343 family)
VIVIMQITASIQLTRVISRTQTNRDKLQIAFDHREENIADLKGKQEALVNAQIQTNREINELIALLHVIIKALSLVHPELKPIIEQVKERS